jgi:hypothetical protein
MSIRPFYDRWPQDNRRLTDVIGAMTEDGLAIQPAPVLFPIWAIVGHTAAARVLIRLVREEPQEVGYVPQIDHWRPD